MQDLFMQGDPVFMGILTLIFLVLIVITVYQWLALSKVETIDFYTWKTKIGLIKSVGLFGLIFGILSQLIGLYGGFKAIQEWGQVAPHVLAAGIRNSMITTIYGLIILLVAYGFWFYLQHQIRQKQS